MNMAIGITLLALVVVAIALALAFLCFLCIWSLNMLSEQAGWGWHIPHTVLSYVSIFLLLSVIQAVGAVTLALSGYELRG